jgi:hypothetical protein
MMRFITLILLFFLPYSLLQAETNFEDTYGITAGGHYSAIADQVVSSRFDESGLPLQQKLTRLKNLQSRIEAKLKLLPDDPLIWFLSGLNKNNLAEVQYLTVLSKLGQHKASTDIEVSNYNIARSRAYDNAIRLDNPQPHRLSSSIYATMGYGLSNRQKIITYSRELELGSPAENESNEWFMHWAKIDALVHEKKLDEAQQALADLKSLLLNKDEASSPYTSIVERAETQVAKEVETAVKRKSRSTGKAKPTPVESAGNIYSWNWKNWLLTGIGIFTFGFVFVAAIYVRKA